MFTSATMAQSENRCCPERDEQPENDIGAGPLGQADTTIRFGGNDLCSGLSEQPTSVSKPLSSWLTTLLDVFCGAWVNVTPESHHRLCFCGPSTSELKAECSPNGVRGCSGALVTARHHKTT
ncbi:hypothetical protein CRM22_005784 [Opisthorchis felineus]|uniref:Uncharacterized protein n=1 Tax=Opisthorchis felineus TaxID=147828 RepID=A0A4S2LWF7_OPIFE|nr:hypothetical protein CRM22_005784 [Opisthorchis felineus]